jgi:CBS domain-containing protein
VPTSTTNFTEKERKEFRKTHSFNDCLDIVRYPAGWSKDELELANTILTENGILSGLSSNADVRRGLLKNINNFNSILPQDIINNTPVTINEEATITEMLKLVKSKKFLISFLPVVDKGNTLKGYITFINLIRSES